MDINANVAGDTLENLYAKYASLARSKYNFGAGTAKEAPTVEQINEIEANMDRIKRRIAEIKNPQLNEPTTE